MSGLSKTTTLKPRSPFDRQLAKIEQQIVWEHSSESVRENLADKDRLGGLAEKALRIGEMEGATPTIKLRSIAVAKECILAATQIRTGTILDRTIPTLSRAEVQAVIASLPRADDEIDAERASDPIAAERRAMREALREICNGRSLPPDLKLLVANGDG